MRRRYPERFLFKFFRESGGSAEMNVDGSVTPVNFDVVHPHTATKPERDAVFINRINCLIVDGNLRPSFFGGIAALTNGVTIDVLDAQLNSILDITAGEPIKTNVKRKTLSRLLSFIFFRNIISRGITINNPAMPKS